MVHPKSEGAKFHAPPDPKDDRNDDCGRQECQNCFLKPEN